MIDRPLIDKQGFELVITSRTQRSADFLECFAKLPTITAASDVPSTCRFLLVLQSNLHLMGES